jgi:hypothetical protein
MAKLSWGNPGERLFEVGVDRGVLFPPIGPGVAWSGLIAVNESPSGGEANPFYMDGIKYQDRGTAEEFAGSIEAYTYPLEFAQCDGSTSLAEGLFAAQQYRRPFSLSYRTKIGNDLDGEDHGYKLHIVYNAKTTPTERGNKTTTGDLEAMTFNWGFTTIPERINGIRPTAHLILDSTSTSPFVLSAIEDLIYGTDSTVSELPTPLDLLEIFAEGGPIPPFIIELLEDGMFSATGSATDVIQLDPDHFQLDSDSVTVHGDGTYTATSE